MSHFEYMQIMLQRFLQFVIYQYNTMDLVDKDGFVYVKICKGIYDLKQSDCINFDHIVKLLKLHGYYTLCYNLGIWGHETLPTNFLFLWMNLVLNTLILLILTILLILYINTTKYLLSVKGKIDVGLL